MKILQLNPFGAEISGIDLSKPVSSDDAATLKRTYDEQSVLVFRNQRISDEDHVKIVELLLPGRSASSDLVSDPRQFSFLSNDLELDDGNDGLEETKLTFHSDYSFTTDPDELVSLYGYKVEDGVSPTEFSSSKVALELLPPELRKRLEGLKVINAVRYDSSEARMPNFCLPGANDLTGVSDKQVFRATWSAILRHPRTGHEQLFVNEMHSHHFEGLSIADSHMLLEQVYGTLYSDKTIYRHVWHEGDLVVWDNFATSHGRRASPVTKAARTLRRVKIGNGRYTEFERPL